MNNRIILYECTECIYHNRERYIVCSTVKKEVEPVKIYSSFGGSIRYPIPDWCPLLKKGAK
jgi:hypothetical protein